LLGWVSSSPSLLLLLLLLLHEINRKSVTLLQKLLLCLYVCVCVPALERERDEEKPLFVGWVSSSPLLLLHEINRRVLSCCKSSSSVCVSVCVWEKTTFCWLGIHEHCSCMKWTVKLFLYLGYGVVVQQRCGCCWKQLQLQQEHCLHAIQAVAKEAHCSQWCGCEEDECCFTPPRSAM
jgi:hypothetical protein